jgi:hypothetical protein
MAESNITSPIETAMPYGLKSVPEVDSSSRNQVMVKTSLTVLIVMLCAVLILKFWRKRINQTKVKQPTVWEKLEIDFKNIENSDPITSDSIQLSSQISLFLRMAYGQIIGYSCEDLTTDEFIVLSKEKCWTIPGVSNEGFIDVLKAADTVRFAGKSLEVETFKLWSDFVKNFWQACNLKRQEVTSGPV